MRQQPDLRGGWTIAYHSSPYTLEAGWYIRPTNGSPQLGAYMTSAQAEAAAAAIARDNNSADERAEAAEHDQLIPAAGGSQRELLKEPQP